MLSNNIPFELDKNAIFLRNQELQLHHNKLYSIHNRKNKYLSPIDTTRHSRNPYTDNYYITKGNEIFLDKLMAISTRANKAIEDNKAFNQYLNKKNKAMQAIKELNSKKMIEFNNQYHKRLLSVNSVVDLKKMEEDFQVTRRVYKVLRKIQPNQSAANLFPSYTQSTLSRVQRRKEKLPHINLK